MRMTKSEHHEAIRERAREALRDLYHNATPRYPSLDDEESERFQSWFEDAARFEIEYINGGGAYGSTSSYRKTLMHNANAGRFKSPAAQAYYVRKGMRDMACERARCNRLDSRQADVNAMWEYARETFGQLYQYGRGGRTLAPCDLMGRGNHTHVDETALDERPIGEVVEAIAILESLNAYIAAWCKSVPEQWAEYVRESLDENAERGVN